jgi:hypothetical protein
VNLITTTRKSKKVCHVSSTPTVSENKQKFSAREIKDADRAVDLHRKSGYQAVGNLKEMLETVRF